MVGHAELTVATPFPTRASCYMSLKSVVDDVTVLVFVVVAFVVFVVVFVVIYSKYLPNRTHITDRWLA